MPGNPQGLALSKHSVQACFLSILSSGPQEERTLRELACEILLRGMFNARMSNYASLRIPFQ